jgi:hypothetical protein
MRAVLFVASALFACLHGHAAGNVEKCPKAYRGLEVQARLQGSVLARNQPVPVVVTLHNGGTSEVRLRSYMEPASYWLNFEVIGPAGREIPYTGTEYKIIDDGTRRMTLDPGYFWGRRIDDLRELYDLTKPGRYRIRAIYGVSPMGRCRHGSIVSDPVSFEVK